MGIKISEDTKKHVLRWDEHKSDLLLDEYEYTIWNPISLQYDVNLLKTNKVGGADYANMFDFSSSTITIISSSDTWYKLSSNTISVYSKGFSHSNNRLTKVGDAYSPIKLECNTSVSAANNDLIQAAFFKNGLIIPCSLGEVVASSGGKGSTIAFHCMTDMLNDDYIEIWVKNKNATTNITLDVFNVILTELI